KIESGDQLIDVQITEGSNDIVLATKYGLSIRFHENDVREMGRDTTGVKGVDLSEGDQAKGMGKCSPIEEYRVQKRGGKGFLTPNRTEKTGEVVALKEVLPDDELMLITKQGIVIRMPVKGIRVSGRNTQGVKLVHLDDGDIVCDVARVVIEDDEGGEEVL